LIFVNYLFNIIVDDWELISTKSIIMEDGTIDEEFTLTTFEDFKIVDDWMLNN